MTLEKNLKQSILYLKKEEEEQGEAAQHNTPFDGRGGIPPPAVGYKIMGHTADNDYKTFIPHSYIYQDGDSKEPRDAPTHPFQKKE